MNGQMKALPFPIKPYPTGRKILLNQALPYFTKCVESLVLLICMKVNGRLSGRNISFFGIRNSDLIHAQTNCSAVIPLYLINPIAAKGNAPKIQTQLSVSVPNRGRRRKYKPTATPQARTEKMNCLRDSPKNILSV